MELQCPQGLNGVQMLRKILTVLDFDKLRMHVNMAGVISSNTDITLSLPTNRRHGIRENSPSSQRKGRESYKRNRKGRRKESTK